MYFDFKLHPSQASNSALCSHTWFANQLARRRFSELRTPKDEKGDEELSVVRIVPGILELPAAGPKYVGFSSP